MCYNELMEESSSVQIVLAILAILALIGNIVGAIIGYWGKSKKQSIEDAKREQKQIDNFEKIFDWMREVEIKLDTHNHYAEKIGSIEKSVIEIKTDLKYVKESK